jgi:hypothetical protein
MAKKRFLVSSSYGLLENITNTLQIYRRLPMSPTTRLGLHPLQARDLLHYSRLVSDVMCDRQLLTNQPFGP